MARVSLRERRAARQRRSPGFDRRLVAPLVLGATLNPINSSMIAVALVPIGLALHVSAASTAWLVSGLYLATAVGQPIVGRLVDEFGARPVYLSATTLVGAAGLLGALAPNLNVLIVARVLLGVGTCAGYPAAMHLIRREAQRTGLQSPSAILATLAVSAQTVLVIGPTIGGLAIGLFNWRAIFALNVPLSILCVGLGAARLPATRREDRVASDLDVTGMVLFGLTLSALMYFLMRPSLAHAPILVLTVLAGALFARRETRREEPFIDLKPLGANPALLATYLRQLTVSIISYSFLYGFSQWMEAGRGLNASVTGLVLLPMFLIAIVVTAATGRRPQVRAKLLTGGVVQIVGTLALVFVGARVSVVTLVGICAIIGVPQGLNSLANQNALYHQASADRVASSAGLLRTFTYLGAILAAAINAWCFGRHASTQGLHDLGAVLVTLSVFQTIVTVLDRRLSEVGRVVAT
ncbi:MAG: MFS transporter [Acidobacteriota bacterium]|nr:MFS transporter [Acidobacteriota bacterium]MDE3222336.1 MFS transporter [Acidobacteriota bacterium]